MKKITIVIVSVFLVGFVSAQKNPFLKIDENRTIKAVVNEAIYILRQDFYIIDTTSKRKIEMGLNHKDYFGRYYFVAILADGKFYTDNNINAPWKLDVNFNNLKESKKYIPALSNLAFKRWDEKDFKQIDSLEIYNKSRKLSLNQNSRYTYLTAPDSLQCLKIASDNETLMDSTSYHWTISANEAKSFNENIFLDTIPTLDFNLSKGKYSVEKKGYVNTNFFYFEKTLGGFIFTTKASFGKLEYFLSGMILRINKGKFDMLPIISTVPQYVPDTKKEIKKIPAESNKTEPKEQEIKLTKIKDNNQ